MTWFQLVNSQLSDPEPRAPRKLVPNSAMFLNPALALQSMTKPVSHEKGTRKLREPSPRLRLIKGSRVDSVRVPSAA